MNKLQAAEQLRRALQLFAETLNDDQALEVAVVYPEWTVPKDYTLGAIISYGLNRVGDPQLYRCQQTHVSQADWTPDATPALWKSIGIGDDGVPVWSQPTGAHDAYNTGDRVHYPGIGDTIYTSLIDGNIWSPDAYPAGWTT